MKVLLIATDRKIFEEESLVLKRTKAYASYVEEMHVVISTEHNFQIKKHGNLYIYPTNSKRRWQYPFDSLNLSKKIINENGLNKENCVISTQDPFESGWVGRKIKDKFGLPLQVQIHTDFLNPHFKNSFLNRIRVHLAKRHVIYRADRLRVVSSVIKTSIEQKFPKFREKIDILPIFVDVESIVSQEVKRNLRNDFPQFNQIILMVSRLTKEKRIDIALNVFKKIIKDFPRSGLIIVGDGSELNNLSNLAKKLMIRDNVIFLGWQEDLVSFYKSADLFLHTSEFEGYGMVFIEAGAAGCPIITTKVGVAKTDLFKNGENSFVCDVEDYDCIKSSIIKLFQNELLKKQFSKNMQSQIRSQSGTFEQYVRQYVSLLEKLLK